jgi:cell division initiation protein
MSLSPVEIRHIRFARGAFGYKRSAVERTLDEIGESFEEVWRDRADLADKVEQLEADIARYREVETLLHTTLVTAERSAAELKEQAKREAELILAEAHEEARRISFAAHDRHSRLTADLRRLRTMLASALAAVDEGDADPNGGEDEIESRPEKREEPWRGTGEWAA